MPESMTQILEWASCILDVMAEGITEPFALTIIATFVAAFAGAWGAQHISDRNQRREDMIEEIRNTNAAITAAFSISNSCLSLKKQHVRDLKDNFDKTRSDAVAHQEGIKTGTIAAGTVFNFDADFQTFMPLTLPIKALEKQLFEKISASTRALGLFNALNGVIESLNESIIQRNHLVHKFKNTRFASHADMAYLYFGFPNSAGHLDTTYPDTIRNIYSLLDDCIFFSSKLCETLESHGNNVRKKKRKKLPMINQVKFDAAHDLGLMPSEDGYQEWISMFQSREKR